MKAVFGATLIVLLVVLGAFSGRREHNDRVDFKKNIKFNHLFVVIDDSTYKHLFNGTYFPKDFARTSEETVNTGSKSWTGKYIFGTNNYLEIFKPGGMKGSKLGSFGLGFITNKYGAIDSLQHYWSKTLDSVHVENKMSIEDGKATPWFKSVSIPTVDSLRISAWVIENSKAEMHFAGFTDNDLAKEIEFSEYLRRVRAKFKNIPVDSIKNDKLFEKVISLTLGLTDKELSYLRKFLLDVGFVEKGHSFLKEDFTIRYSLVKSGRTQLKEIGFSLVKKVPKAKYSSKTTELELAENKATMRFRHD